MPNDVYLVGDVNAFVTHRGGFMGFGSRRVMGLGLPLLQLVTVSELKAIVAHEFGHYCAGDVRLGPWIYKTRAAIVRTLQGLSGTVFQGLFVGYARMFLRVSSAVSRHQEYLADRLAAETAGASRLISALTRVASGTRAFHIYLANDVMPVLGAGYAPPLVDGFARFLAEPHIAEALSKGTDTSQPTADPNDTHPRLADRIKAVEALLASEDVDHSGPAIDLLDNAMSLDQALLTYNPDGPPRSLVPVSWSSVAMQVFLPQWLRALEQIAPHLGEVRVEKLPTSVSGAIPLARGLKNPAEGYVSGDELARRLVWAVGAAVCVTLARRGWTFDLAPGRGFRVSDGSLECAPFVEAEGIVFGRTRSERWIEFCAKTGLSGSPRDLAGSLSVSAAFRLEKN
jgi:hypothetical protein